MEIRIDNPWLSVLHSEECAINTDLNIENLNSVMEKYLFEMITPQTIRKIINDLNNLFFQDNIASFVDVSVPWDIDMNNISLAIKYRNELYNLRNFQKIYLKINRMRKLNKIYRNF